ncbi:ROK family xylose-responsive transcription regulator [Burkholderia cenocepacia]|nr:ROK family xylose-responsive transcription regulator [Burkholderia cenocepacia]ARF88705.1 ROK family xylose-responsive transcription regulator [Burkholderia cenocepacia]
MRDRVAGCLRRAAIGETRCVRDFAVCRPCDIRHARSRRLRPSGLHAGRLAFARRAGRLHDGAVRIHELHVVHRPGAAARLARHADRTSRIVGRHVGLHDRCAGARYAPALLREVGGGLVAICGRHGRITGRDVRVLRDRRRRTVAGIAQPAGEALAHRRDAGRARRDMRVAPLLRIDVLREVRDRLAVHERGGRYGRDRVRRAEVHVRLVDVGDIGDVRHVHGLVHVDVVHHDVAVDALVVVRTPAAPARMPRLARAEREPCAAGRGDAADRQRHIPVGTAATAAAHEGDERRRIDGRLADDHRAGHPGPAVVHVRPAAVVIRREAPRRVVDPGPAPRRLPDPVAVVIRRPVGRRVVRHPDRAVVRRFAPRAVRIEILVAGDVAGHVAGRHRARFGRVAAGRPLVERIGARCGRLLRDLQVGAGEHDLLPGRQRVLPVAAVGRRAAAAHRHRRARAVRRHIDAIVAGARDAEREVRRVDFIRSAGRQIAHVRRHGAEAHFQLRRRVVEIQHRQARRLAEPHRGRADVQFRARAGIVPELVAGRQRPVHRRIRPRIGAGRFGRHGARQVIEPRDAAGRIAARLPCRGHIRRRIGRLREGGRQRRKRDERKQRVAGGALEREQGGHGERHCCDRGASIRAVEFTISAWPVSRHGVL